MFPPIYAVCAADPAVTALLGTAPTRFIPFGEVEQGTVKPYATWFVVAGAPENYLDKRPDIDRFVLQIDCWAVTATGVRNVAEAIRDAVEGQAYVISWRGEDRDPETQLYRYGFDVEWFVKR